jgi:hypothetical protein
VLINGPHEKQGDSWISPLWFELNQRGVAFGCFLLAEIITHRIVRRDASRYLGEPR